MDKRPHMCYNHTKLYESAVSDMPLSLLPQIITNSITDLTVQQFQQWGVRLLMLDFDNTIIPYTTDTSTPEVQQWLQEMKQSGIQLCVVSNSKKERVRRFCSMYGIHCITNAQKPFSKGIRECMEQYQISPEECALIGDQIFTDTLGANCCGVRSVLVKSIHNHTIWLKARHVLELPFIYLARRRRINYEKS